MSKRKTKNKSVPAAAVNKAVEPEEKIVEDKAEPVEAAPMERHIRMSDVVEGRIKI